MAFKMKYTKGNFPHKQNTSPNKFLGAMMKAGAGLLGKRKSAGGFPGFGLFGGGPRGAAAMLKKNKDK